MKGRRRKTFLKQVEEIGKSERKTLTEMKELARDQKVWKS